MSLTEATKHLGVATSKRLGRCEQEVGMSANRRDEAGRSCCTQAVVAR